MMTYPDKQTTYSPLEDIKPVVPRVLFTLEVLMYHKIMAEEHDTEVGLLGHVTKRPGNIYVIDKVYYLDHSEANCATCEISGKGETQLIKILMDSGKDEWIREINYWAHSHNTMDVFASGQDENQAIERMKKTENILIRGIFNNKNALHISFFDFFNKVRFDNLKWETETGVNTTEIREEIKKLKAENIPKTRFGSYNVGNGYVFEDNEFGISDYQKSLNEPESIQHCKKNKKKYKINDMDDAWSRMKNCGVFSK